MNVKKTGELGVAKKRRGSNPKRIAKSLNPTFGFRTIVALALGVIAFVLLFGWNGLLPLVTVPLIVGAFMGLLASGVQEALALGASTGLAGSLLACWTYTFANYLGYLDRITVAVMRDVERTFASDLVIPLLQGNPVNDSRVGPVLVVTVGTALTTLAALGVFAVARRFTSPGGQRWLGFVVIAPLAICLASTIFVNAGSFVRYISIEPANRTYGADHVINLKTYYLMRQGGNYYDSIIRAAAGDFRLIKEAKIKNGKWNGGWGINSPTRVRQPEVFYVWAAVGYFGASGIVWTSILLAVLVGVLWYWGLFSRLGQRALFIPMALFPLFVVHIGWLNLFNPDWWATLMLSFSAAFLLRRRFVAAAAFGLAAALFREVLVIWLMVLLLVAIIQLVRKQLSSRDTLAFGLAFVVFVAAFAAHYFAEAPYLGVTPVKEGTVGTIVGMAHHSLADKFLVPTSYLTFPYGTVVVPAFILLIFGALGFLLVFRGNDFARFATSGYLLFFLAFMLVIGATSSYWGQDLSLIGFTGLAILIAGIDRLGASGSLAAASKS